jgi:hypothetical protein
MNLYRKMYQETKTLAACPITGIVIRIDIPRISIGKILEYPNPFSVFENAQGIAKLEFIEQNKIPPTILSGVLLSVWNHFHLIEDHLTGIQRNEILIPVPPYHLISAIRFFSDITMKESYMLPRISLDSEQIRDSSILDVVRNYTLTCKQTLSPDQAYSEQSSRVLSYTKINKATKRDSITSELRNKAKDLVNTLANESELSPKLLSILRLICQKNNLITLHYTIRDKVISRLEGINTIASIALIDILKNVEKNLSTAERLFKQEDDEKMDSIFPDIPSLPEKKKTLKELLQERIIGVPPKESIEDDEEDEIEEQESFTSFRNQITFLHGDCKNCDYDISDCPSIGFCSFLEDEKEEKAIQTRHMMLEIGAEMGIISKEMMEEEQEHDNANTF